MQMNDLRRTCTFMEIIDVLGDNSHFMFFFQFCNHTVSFIRFDLS